ncbi:hypothetical protein GOBAR_DD02847 [Gossypium barbadense]|nr:hypothetical protein GOBAR_DD02847 [Gossypium barbadense]
MSKVVEKTGSNSLIMDSSYGQGALTNLRCASPKFACIVREYFVDFEIDVAAFPKTKVSGPKANEIISKIGLDCSHGIEARGKKLSSTNILVQLFMVFQINRNLAKH